MGVIAVDIRQDPPKPKRRRKRDSEKPNTAIASVVAIDPGETTGWSLIVVDPICLVDPSEKVLANILQHQHGQVDEYRGNGHIPNEGESMMCTDLAGLLDSWPDAAVIIEDFILMQKRKDRSLLSPVRITAKLELRLWENGRTYFRQQPGDAKNTCTDERLRAWGMYETEGALEHARDADRHAILFLRRATQSRRLRAAAWPHLYGRGAPYA